MFATISRRIASWVSKKDRVYLLLGVLCLLGSVTLTAHALLTVSNSGLLGDGAVTIDGAGVLNLGTASSTAVVIGNSGIPVTIPGTLTLGSASSTGQLIFRNASTSFTTTLHASSSQASNLTLTLPPTLGTSGQAMLTDGTGNLYFGNVASSQWLSGASGTIYYNSGNVGINTSTPTALLSLVGSSSSPASLFNISSSSGASLFNVSGNGTVTVGATVLTADGRASLPMGSATNFIGDSITNGANGTGWVTQVPILSSGAVLQLTGGLGIGGNTTAQMLARFSTACAGNPDKIMILGGTNDAAQAIALATTKANIIAMIAAARACGAIPILGTIPPSNTSGYHTAVSKINAMLFSVSVTQRVRIVDFYSVLVDPSTDNYLTNLNSDVMHPSNTGYRLMATLWVSKTADLYPTPGVYLAGASTDGINMLANPVFLGPGAPAFPTSWNNGSTSSNAPTITTVADSAILGNWLQVVQPAGGTGHASVQSNAIAASGHFAAGDTIQVSLRIQTSGIEASGGGSVYLSFWKSGELDIYNYAADIPNGVITWTGVLPAGTTNIWEWLFVYPGTSGDITVKVSEWSVIDLTALGLP